MPTAAENNTDLVIEGLDFPPFSVRGNLVQTLTPISQSIVVARAVDGTLLDLSGTQFHRKYDTRIECSDQQRVPALDGLRPGQTIIIDCVTELAYLDESDADAQKVVVPGSTRSENGYIFYRPRLTCMLINFDYSYDEWDKIIGWTLDASEI